MVSYKIQWDRRALKELRTIDQSQARTILKKINTLANNPLRGKRLKGEFRDYRRLRIGKYRVIYAVHKNTITVLILRVGARDQVYKDPS